MSLTSPRRGPAAVILLLVVLTAAAVALVALSACGTSDTASTDASPSPSGITVTDDAGNTVALAQPAERIVSLAPANTEIVFAVGAGDKLMAGTSYDDYPEAAKDLPKVGDFSNPSVEKIASFNPDLVLATGGIQAGLLKKLEKLGMQVYVLEPKTYDAVMRTITNVGQLTGTSDQATTVVDGMQKAKDDVQAAVGSLDPAATFLEIYSKPLMTAGTDTFIDDMIRIAGGTNLGAMAGSGFPNFSSEVLFRENPAVYIADSGSMSKPGPIAKRAGYAELDAIKNGHVYVIEDSLIARPGPRLAQGLQELAKMIHPEAYGTE